MSSIPPVGQSNAYYPPSRASDAAGSGTPAAGEDKSVDESFKPKSDPEEEFLKFAKMSLPEKIRYRFLSAHGLTEDDLKAMDEKERQKIEDQIREEIERAVNQETGKRAGGLANIVA